MGCNCGKKKRALVMTPEQAAAVVDQGEATPDLPPDAQNTVERSASA